MLKKVKCYASMKSNIRIAFWILLPFLISNNMSSSPPSNKDDTTITDLFRLESSPYREPESSPYKEPESSPYKEPESSPYKEPESSPYKEPESSPYKEPESSPYKEPESSPYKEPESSPFKEPASSSCFEDPPSSPYTDPQTPPPNSNFSQIPSRTLSSSSLVDDDGSPDKKRRKYYEHVENPSGHSYESVVQAGSSQNASISVSQLISKEPQCSSGNTVTIVGTHEPITTSGLQLEEPIGTSAGTATVDASQPGNSSCVDQSFYEDVNSSSTANIVSVCQERFGGTSASSSVISMSDVTSSDSFSSSDSSSSSESSSSSDSSLSSNSSSSCSSSASSLQDSDSDSDNSDSDSNYGGRNSLLPKRVFEGSPRSVDEGVLCVMNLFMKKKLEKSLMGGILNAILQILPKENNLPKSQHLLFKYVRDLCPLSPPKIHYYCKKCQFYVGEENAQCSICESECCKFIQLSLADQIKNLFQLHNLSDLIDNWNSHQNTNLGEGKYLDITDGSEFKRAWCGGVYDLVLHGYTDGVSLSESSDVHLWPLEFTICQLPFNLRFRFVLICGIWVDSSKPLLNTYLMPFVKELQELHQNGVKWIHPLTKMEFTSRVSVPGFCGDAPVRAQAQQVSQHGGRYCCNVCEQKMVSCICKETQRKKRVFCFKEKDHCLRTAERMEKQGKITRKMKKVNPQRKVKPCKGVKGRTIISKIPSCDRSKAVYPEYMHLLLGLIKGVFMKLWFTTNAKDKWSLKAHIDDINSILTSIKVPDHMRAARSIDDYLRWKASECRSFLLFYSLVALSPFMKPHYFQHWLLFVFAVYLLLQDCVTESDILRSESLLRLFLRDFSKLYRAEDFTYNLHNLLHVGLTTRLYGPLSGSSAFMYESLNGDLRNCIHGTKNIAMELTNTLNLFQGIQVLKSRVEARNICPETLIDKNSVQLLSKANLKTIKTRMRSLVSRANLQPPYSLFYRCVIKGETYTSVFYSRQVQKNNYTVGFLNSQGVKHYGEINLFCLSDEKKMALVNLFDVEHLRTFCHLEANVVVTHIVPVKLSDKFDLVPAENILSKLVKVGDFVCCQPNKIEVNL